MNSTDPLSPVAPPFSVAPATLPGGVAPTILSGNAVLPSSVAPAILPGNAVSSNPDLDLLVIGTALVEITPDVPGIPLTQARSLIPFPSGAAANFALALARLGRKVGFLSRVGDDELGEWLRERLAEHGVDVSQVTPVPGQLTTVSFCWMDGAGAKTFYFYRFAGKSDPMAVVTEADIKQENIARSRIFDFTEATIRKEPLRSAAMKAARLAREAGREVCYAVNYRPASWSDGQTAMIEAQRRAIAAADIVVMNEDEARLLTGNADLPAAIASVAGLGPRVIAVTCGERGALLRVGEQEQWVPGRKVVVRYDIGAGDTFHAGLCAGHLMGLPPDRLGRFASDAAALKISRDGSPESFPTCDEVLACMEIPI